METLVIVALGVLLFLIIAPIWSLIRSNEVSRQIEQLEFKLRQVETELARLKHLAAASTPKPPVPTEETKKPEPEVIPALSQPVAPQPPPIPTIAPEPLIKPSALESPPVIPAESPKTPPPVPKPAFSTPSINWEQFMGVKLFAWIGGLALFIGVALFLKYSFEHNLVPPWLRATVGFITGAGLIIGGIRLSRKQYAVTSQTLCATGVVILYAVIFACHGIYRFPLFTQIPSFMLMGLITATAFLLAVRFNALVIAILGMLGGFLTPVLLSTGQDNPVGLFGYIVLLDIGLIAVAFHRRWHFLTLAAAIGTAWMQVAWLAKFFTPGKIHMALGVFALFNVLFTVAFYTGKRLSRVENWLMGASLTVPLLTFGFVQYLLSFTRLGNEPWNLFAFVLVADVCVMALALWWDKLLPANMGAGLLSFILLSTWTMSYLNVELLYWGLGLYLVFAALHALFPILLQRIRKISSSVNWAHLFPPLALLLMMIPIAKLTDYSLAVWPCILLVDLLAIGLAVLAGSVVSVVAVLLLTLTATALWIFRVPDEINAVPMALVLIGGFALFFFVAVSWAGKRILARLEPETVSPSGSFAADFFNNRSLALTQLPAMSAILPFLLLIMVTIRLPLPNPSSLFGTALLFSVLILGVSAVWRQPWLPAVGLVCAAALEHAWHVRHFQPEAAALPLAWYLGFGTLFFLFPFATSKRSIDTVVPWASAALSLPAHFHLVHRLVAAAYPNDWMGLLPAAFAVPSLAGLAWLYRKVPADHSARTTQLAWFGGVSLFFITMIIPIQFDREWITIGWALEGAALLWLFHRIPHPGLRYAGLGLLTVAFVRLAVNPAVLEYHPRTATPILNWYLYAYGTVALAFFVAARFMAPPRDELGGRKVPPVLYSLGTILLFLLVNIEIADYFGTGQTLTFEFSGNFARDMTYTIAWGLFAFVILVIGFQKRLRGARYAGVGLLSVTLLKLFFHDLASLKQLYRVGALISIAIIAMLASFLYQKFLSSTPAQPEADKRQ